MLQHKYVGQIYDRIGEMPVQAAENPRTAHEARARFLNKENAAHLRAQTCSVPDHLFTDEPKKALSSDTPTCFIDCDISGALGCSYPATVPLILARYARICAGEKLGANFQASGIIIYVIAGAGHTDVGNERIDWSVGDVFILPGGMPHTHISGLNDSVLWVVTNEPQLKHEALQPPLPSEALTRPVHYSADEIERQHLLMKQLVKNAPSSNRALIFTSEDQEYRPNVEPSPHVLPTLTLAMNTLGPGTFQTPHKHNAVAVTLIIKGKNCYSLVDGARVNWSPWATAITPSTKTHSHHNEGSEDGALLIVQDNGLYCYARTQGFTY